MMGNEDIELVAAMVTDVTQGADFIKPPIEYIPQILKMTEVLDIPWIVDKVLRELVRTVEWFGYQRYGVEPDIITTAKGLSSFQFQRLGESLARKSLNLWISTVGNCLHLFRKRLLVLEEK